MQKNMHEFWKSRNSKFKSKGGKRGSQSVDGFSTESEIANVFVKFLNQHVLQITYSCI